MIHSLKNLLGFFGQPDPTDEMLQTHLAIRRYGNFTLTDAVRPSYDVKVRPRQGYRRDSCAYEGRTIPVLRAAASAEILLELYLALLPPLGAEVDIMVESSHGLEGRNHQAGHVDFLREEIDLSVFQSVLLEFEELILHDGCTGVATMNCGYPAEVQLDEHKLLAVFAANLVPYEAILIEHGVHRDDSIRFLTEAEHLHSTSGEYFRQCRRLQTRLGAEIVL